MDRSLSVGCRLVKSSREASAFPDCGPEYKQLFSCCTSMLCLPYTPFLSHPPLTSLQVPLPSWPRFSSDAAYTGEPNSSSSVLLIYCSSLPSLSLKFFFSLKFSPLGFPFSFFWSYLLCSFFFLTTLSLGPPT